MDSPRIIKARLCIDLLAYLCYNTPKAVMIMNEISFQNIRCLIRKPKDFNPEKRYPVLLFLHGAGTRGNDISKLYTNPFFQFLSNFFQRSFITLYLRRFICFPKCNLSNIRLPCGESPRGKHATPHLPSRWYTSPPLWPKAHRATCLRT